MEKILVRRAGAQGDVLIATPVIAALQKQGQVTVATSCPEALEGFPGISVVKYGHPTAGFDRVIDLIYELEPKRPRVEVYAEQAGVKVADPRPIVYSTESAAQLAKKLAPEGALLFHCDAGWPCRKWKRFPQLVERLKGYPIIEVGSAELPNAKQFGRIPLALLAELVKRSRLVVGLDSFVAHVATAVGKPVVVVFGCTKPELVMNGDVEVVTRSELECLGCHHEQPPPAYNCECKLNKEAPP